MQDTYIEVCFTIEQKVGIDRPTEAQTDRQSAIALAQAKQAEDPMDWSNNFNLALYYLAAGRFDESDGLYGRSSEASGDAIEDAIQDLDDYLTLFPDRLQAREVRDSLSEGLRQRLSVFV